MLTPLLVGAGLVLHYAPHRAFGWVRNAAAAQHDCMGHVLHVIDGDTVWMRCNGKRIKVRLDGIDAPEVAHPYWNQHGQPDGERARSALIDLIGGEAVTLIPNGKDKYGRTLGVLRLYGTNINLEMVQKGWAWAYRGFTTAPYVRAQRAARAAHRSLWALPPGEREAPWKFRHSH